MRRRSLLLLSAILLSLFAAGWWCWQQRHQILPAIAAPWLGGGELRTLRNFQLGRAGIRVEYADLLLADGMRIQLSDLHLLHAVHLLFKPKSGGSQLQIAQATITPSPHPPAADKPEAEPLRLSALLKQLREFPLQQVRIDELVWDGDQPHSGQLTLHREDGALSGALTATLLSGNHQARLTLTTGVESANWQLRLLAKDTDEALLFTGQLQSREPELWHGHFRLSARLEPLQQFPLLQPLVAAASGARGELQLSLESLIPDRVLEFEGYRQLAAELAANSLKLSLPDRGLGAPLELTLNTDLPFSAELESLVPLQPTALSGNADVLIGAGSDGSPLLSAQLETDAVDGEPRFNASGLLYLQAAAPLLAQHTLPGLALSRSSGQIPFRALVQLAPLEQIAQDQSSSIRQFLLELLPGDQAAITVSATGDDNDFLQQIRWREGTAALQLDAPLILSGQAWPGPVQLAGSGLQLALREARDRPSLELKLRDLSCELQELSECQLALEARTSELSIMNGGMKLAPLSASAGLAFSARGQERSLNVSQLQLAANSLAMDGLQAQTMRLNSPALNCQLSSAEWQCGAESLALDFAALEIPEVSAGGGLDLSDFQVRGAQGQLSASASYSAEDLSLKLQDQFRGRFDLSGAFTLSGDTLNGTSRIEAGPLAASGEWQHRMDSGSGSGRFTLAPATFSRSQPLSSALQGLPVDLVAGQLSASGQFSWPEGADDFLQLQLEQVAATLDDIYAVGIQGQLALRREGELWYSPQPQRVALETLDAGLAISKLAFDFSLNKNQDLVLEQLRAELLEGTLESPRLLWNLNGERRQSQVNLSGISLRALAREMEAENFAASGLIDARIPLVTDGDGVTVEKGQVQARPPGGRLRYYGAFSPDMLASNPQLKLIAGALEDYNYRELSGTLEYAPSGDMELQLKLVGRSSSVAADRDLIINLNLENNIPDMLRSMQASRDLTEVLEKHIR